MLNLFALALLLIVNYFYPSEYSYPVIALVSFNKFQPFIEDVWEAVHTFGTDQLVAFLTTHANIPDVTDRLLANVTEISYTNLSSRNITTASSGQSGGTYTLVLTDLVLTASGAVATFRHAGFYNDGTAVQTNPLCGWWDYGSDVTLASGETFTYDFGASVISST